MQRVKPDPDSVVNEEDYSHLRSRYWEFVSTRKKRNHAKMPDSYKRIWERIQESVKQGCHLEVYSLLCKLRTVESNPDAVGLMQSADDDVHETIDLTDEKHIVDAESYIICTPHVAIKREPAALGCIVSMTIITDMSPECLVIIIKALLCNTSQVKLSHLFITCKAMRAVSVRSGARDICTMMLNPVLTDSSARFSTISKPDDLYRPCRMKIGKNVLDWQYTQERRQWAVQCILRMVRSLRISWDILEELVYTWEQCSRALIMRSLETNFELHHETILCAAVHFTVPEFSMADIITASQSRLTSLTIYAIKQCQIAVIDQLVIKQGAYLHTITPFAMLDLGFFGTGWVAHAATNLARIVSCTAMYCRWPTSINCSFRQIVRALASIVFSTITSTTKRHKEISTLIPIPSLATDICKCFEELQKDNSDFIKKLLMAYPVPKDCIEHLQDLSKLPIIDAMLPKVVKADPDAATTRDAAVRQTCS